MDVTVTKSSGEHSVLMPGTDLNLTCPNSGALRVTISGITEQKRGVQLKVLKTGSGDLRLVFPGCAIEDTNRTDPVVRLKGSEFGLAHFTVLGTNQLSLYRTHDGWELPGYAGVEIASGVYTWQDTDTWDDDEIWIDG